MDDIIKSLTCEQISNLNLICKWDWVPASVCISKNLVMMMEVNQMLITFSLVPLQLISID